MECRFRCVFVCYDKNMGGFENAPKQAAAPFLALYTCQQQLQA